MAKHTTNTTHARRRLAGLCIRCGKTAPVEGKIRCVDCAVKDGAVRRRTERERRSTGLCTSCGVEPEKDKTLCTDCLEAKRALWRTTRSRRISEGKCGGCGKDLPAEGGTRCIRCRDTDRRFFARQRGQILDAYGNRCACCGESLPEFLTLDHVHNDGAIERGRGSNSKLFGKIIKEGFPARYQILCWNCNCAKGFYGECPHVRASREMKT